MDRSDSPRVFISYSWDNDDHKAWVRFLAENLRVHGVDVRLDQWHVKPGQSFTQFMESEVISADFVVLVCTPEYAAKSNAREGGVGYEQQIVSGQLVSGVPREKFIPLIRSGSFDQDDNCAIPTHFTGIVSVDFRNDSHFQKAHEQLLRAVFDRPSFVPPPIGAALKLPPASLPSFKPETSEYSAHDLEMLDFFYPCFDRAAFRIPFLVEVPKDMIHAIRDTISAVGTGIRKQNDGTIIAQCRPKADFQSIELRKAFDNISEHLHDISKVYEIAVDTNQLDQRVGAVIRRDEAIPVIIDRKRNEIISIVNQVYTSVGRLPFPLIPDDQASKYDLFDQLRAKYWEEKREL